MCVSCVGVTVVLWFGVDDISFGFVYGLRCYIWYFVWSERDGELLYKSWAILCCI